MGNEQHIRKKRRKRKNILNLLLFVICMVVAFLSGIYIEKNYNLWQKCFGEARITDKTSLELEKMNELKKYFIDTFEELYPTAKLSFIIKNLDTGVAVEYNNQKMNSASLIKLFILETVFDKVSEGTYTLPDELKKELDIMITRSDNNAANKFIDVFGGQNENKKVDDNNLINKHIKSRKYLYTELNRRMHDSVPPGGPSGYQNYSSVSDVCKLLEEIYNNSAFKEPYNTYTLDLLKAQEITSKIPAKITKVYPDVKVANKTGELSQVENDAAIIMGDDFNLVFVIMTDDIPKLPDGNTDYDLKERVQNTIADFGLQLVKTYKDIELQ